MDDDSAAVPARPETLRSVLRALDVLNELASRPQGATPKAVSKALGLHLSTTYHLLNTLQAAGYVARCAQTRLFQLGPRLPYLNNAYLDGVRPAAELVPFVRALQQATGEVTSIDCLHGNVVVSTLVLEGTQPGRVVGGYSGYASPAYATAAGRVLLAWLPLAERGRYLTPPVDDGQRPTLQFDAASLEPELDRIRTARYALDSGREPFPDICCISAPIIRPGGVVLEALSVIMIRARYERDLATLLTTVQVIALAASEALASQQVSRRRDAARRARPDHRRRRRQRCCSRGDRRRLPANLLARCSPSRSRVLPQNGRVGSTRRRERPITAPTGC